MSLYPSLEDMKVDQFIQARSTYSASPSKTPALLAVQDAPNPNPVEEETRLYPKLYPELSEFMGLNLSEDALRQALSMVPAEDYSGLVQANTAAALGGLRFGDQVLQINGENCAGWSTDKAHKVLKNASAERIAFVVRDRPFERTITLHKDINGQLGFIFKKGKITFIVKDSSAARNGLLTDHHICEVNGQNVIGLKDPQITDILNSAGGVITVTVTPTIIFEHMTKKMSSSIVKSLMDHSIPEV
ncbi:syntenin-1 isoform X3 [Salvelinus namaycush]|uniref:Syntenin-1 isoform X3 n=1 Tax=Salvelinus namaycush TaxID=8040 RepID=A0A8U0UHE3_SALNM|nr:syntenin-1 isoform X3 [Salvelinus namaycush]